MIGQYVDCEKPIQDIENIKAHVLTKDDVAYHVFTESSARLFYLPPGFAFRDSFEPKKHRDK